MENSITLYHGTIYEFDKIDVSKGKGDKDFGRGFYTSHDIRHAERLATRNKGIEEERFALRGVKKCVTPWLYTFGFDLDNLVTLIEPDTLPWQFFFGTKRAADMIRFIGRRSIL